MVGLHLFKSSRLNPVADAVATALTSARRSPGGFRVPMILGLSAALVPAMGVAQDASDQGSPASRPTNPSEDGIEMVVVSARRQAIENATERKKNAESIVDSVVADDAGMLPDNSITEVLQRVSGVTISRFNDADHFSTEGNGIQVRGMSGDEGWHAGRAMGPASHRSHRACVGKR